MCVLELRPLLISLVSCVGRADELHSLRVDNAFPFPIAPDEVLLLGSPADAGDMLTSAASQLGGNVLVVDQSDAYVGWTLQGDEALDVFSQLSALSLGPERPCLRQGLVAHVPAKVIATTEAVQVLVSSTFSHHLVKRVRDVRGDQNVLETEARTFAASALGEIVAPVSIGAQAN